MPHHRRVTISADAHVVEGHGKHKRRVALGTTQAPYISSLRIDGRAHAKPWTTYCALAGGADLAYQLSPRPNRKWGASPAAAPLSYGPGHPMPKHTCAP
jgi:putative alpha-1,2-mannosidase